jgi:hypothetical protein
MVFECSVCLGLYRSAAKTSVQTTKVADDKKSQYCSLNNRTYLGDQMQPRLPKVGETAAVPIPPSLHAISPPLYTVLGLKYEE